MQASVSYSARRIFTGDQWIENGSVVVRDGLIESVTIATGEPRYDILAPAFLDLQVYGASGRLFSAYPQPESLQLLHAHNMSSGTTEFLPTVATQSYSVMLKAIAAVRDYWQQGGEGCLGLHLEGPWINPQKRGAHLASYIEVPKKEEVLSLLQQGAGVIKMVTLAPEVCDSAIIDLLLEQGIEIAAGHSDATYEQAMECFDQGIRLVTHLYNAMSPLQHRSPGMVGAAMLHPHVMASIIPDGHHVDWAALRIAKKQMGERLFVITDAVTTTNEGPYPHHPVADHYQAGGVLSGSGLTMLEAFNRLIRFGEIDAAEAFRMCGLYPAKAIGADLRRGKIQKGYEAHLIALQQDSNGYKLEATLYDTRKNR